MAHKKKGKEKSFPTKLYVYFTEGRGLIASETVAEAYRSSDDSERSSDGVLNLACYELKAVGKVHNEIQERWVS